MSIFEKLQAVQTELKVPKGQYNDFGKYKYRSCEDILEAVKPVLAAHRAAITVGDELCLIGERYYIKAIARFWDIDTPAENIENTAYAREPEAKKGMDESQITGTASSYARKYALGGLLLIDDTKDADTNEYTTQINGRPSPEAPKATPKATAKQVEIIKKLVPDQTAMLQYYGVNTVEELSIKQASEVIAKKGGKNNG